MMPAPRTERRLSKPVLYSLLPRIASQIARLTQYHLPNCSHHGGMRGFHSSTP
jgi:hypothetical protein